ncbi:MAG TPA: hypothetical protein VGP27_16725 [Mycobacterium sp.]|nr:hypothetical protein [Mycobacterium sp.]
MMRKLLEERIAQWKIHDPYLHTRVAAETYETATSVLRIRNEAHRAARDSRVVVVPSDVALIYKPGKDFGGRTADKFKWVPIYHTDDRGEPHLLTMEVCVTRKREKTTPSPLSTIIETLQDAPDLVSLGRTRMGSANRAPYAIGDDGHPTPRPSACSVRVVKCWPFRSAWRTRPPTTAA